jgi:hypothetical protein
LPVLDQAATAELKPFCALPRHRLLLGGSLALKPFLRLPQPGAATLAACEVLGELIAAGLTVDLVLGRVDAPCLGDDLGAICS